MMIWASVYSISVKFCRCNVFISPALCSTIFVGRRLNGLSQVAGAENFYGIWELYLIPSLVCA